jgi:acetylornithine deacetylase
MPTYGRKWTVLEDPFSGSVRAGRLYGRGSLDMKAGTAAGFIALECLRELGIRLSGDVFAESVIDEENGGANGTIAARLRHPDIDFAILAEPTGLAVGTETIGGTDWKVTAAEKGAGGIGAGVGYGNPVYSLSRIALALERYDRVLAARQPPTAFDRDMRLRLLTYQLSSGGSTYAESGAVPTDGHLYFWQETFAGTAEQEARRELLSAIGGAVEPGTRLETVIRYLEGHRIEPAHPGLASIRAAYAQLGLPHVEKGIPFATDAFVFRKCSRTEVALVGPVGANPHGIDEYVEVQSVLSLVRIMVMTAIDFCA